MPYRVDATLGITKNSRTNCNILNGRDASSVPLDDIEPVSKSQAIPKEIPSPLTLSARKISSHFHAYTLGKKAF